MRIILCDQFYYPDESAIAQILTDLSLGLAGRGMEVRVLCGSDIYAGDGRTKSELGERIAAANIRIHRVPRLMGGHAKKGKLFRQLWFYGVAFLRLLFMRAPDVYVAQTTPPLLPFVFRVLCFFKRRPYVVIAQDLWPEALEAHGVLRHDSFPYRLLGFLLNGAYRRAARVVGLGAHMRERLLAKGIRAERIHDIHNWAPSELENLDLKRARKRLEQGILGEVPPKSGPPTLLYSGNMGLAHEFQTLLEALRILKAEGVEFRMLFSGGGNRRDEIRAQAEQMKLAVEFLPHQPRELLAEHLMRADVSVITMAESFRGIVVPSKLYGVLAVGSPIAFVGPACEIADVVREAGCGIVAVNGDAEGLARELKGALKSKARREKMARAARNHYHERLGSERSIDEYFRVIESVVVPVR